VGHTSSTGGWRRPPGLPMTGSQRLGSGGNGGGRPAPAIARRHRGHPDHLEVDAAETHYRQALALAEALGLRPLVAHCQLGLGALYRRTGARQQARELLTTAATMFAEMDMRYWLAQA
jgi:hypothetical protein